MQRVLAVLAAAIGLAVGFTTVQASETPDSADPPALVVVENFLLARAARDPWAAAAQCAALLELQDVEGSWFIDGPTTSDWLRQVTDKYEIELLVRPMLADGDIVVWTERLTPRAVPPPEAWDLSYTLEVRAVVRTGKIAYLSGPYPPVPLHRGGTATTGTGDPHGAAASLGPATLFVGSTLGLVVTVGLLTAAASARAQNARSSAESRFAALARARSEARARGDATQP